MYGVLPGGHRRDAHGQAAAQSTIKKDDWVSVSWKMVDKPRKAYKVTVMPPKEEAGEEE